MLKVHDAHEHGFEGTIERGVWRGKCLGCGWVRWAGGNMPTFSIIHHRCIIYTFCLQSASLAKSFVPFSFHFYKHVKGFESKCTSLKVDLLTYLGPENNRSVCSHVCAHFSLENLAISTFSPVSLRSSNGMCVCVCVHVWVLVSTDIVQNELGEYSNIVHT